MSLQKEYVINQTTKRLLRYGYSDFEHDGQFDGSTEEIITDPQDRSPNIEDGTFYWDGTNWSSDPV